MEIVRGLDNLDRITACVVTVGTYDGVHPGHLQILKRLDEIAVSNGYCSTLVTFDPHPKMVVERNKGKQVGLLTTIEEKLELLEQTGLSRTVIINFDKAFSSLSYEQFVKDILVDKLGARIIVVGYDHAFGKNREGNFEKLSELSNKYQFEVERIDPFKIDDKVIGSTLLRRILAEGDVGQAGRLLSRLYSISGKVVHGSSRGKMLQFPTANIDVENDAKLIPANGVYAVDVQYDKNIFKGMLNIGCRPTFNSGKKQVIEVNIFNFNKEIYGESITVLFKERLRDEKRFSFKEELIKQLEEDKKNSMKL